MDGDTRGIQGAVLKFVYLFGKSRARGADTVVWLASNAIGASSTGDYWFNRKRRRPSAAALEEDAARRLWDETERMIASA